MSTKSMLTPRYGNTERKVLRRTLEHILPTMGLAETGIDSVRRHRSRFSTSYDTARVTVRLDDGKVITLFLKNYDTFVKMKNDMRGRREREARVYEELLSAEELGTAAFYGSVWDDDNDRHWILLEFVEGTPVKWCEIEDWLAAAEWLGRTHGYFHRQASRIAACDYLVRHDAAYLAEKPVLATREIDAATPHLSAAFEPIARDYPAFVEAMVASPFTLVHGEFRPKNVMACRAADRLRICAYDWESAAFGSPYYDLAYLVDGFEPPLLDDFFDRYIEGASTYAMPTPSHARMRYEVNCFRLNVSVTLLSKATLKKYDADIVTRLVDNATERYEDIKRSADALRKNSEI